MVSVAIVGCGGIGSRHVQGAAKVPDVGRIQCVEIDDEKIAMSKERLKEISHDKQINFYKKIADLEGNIDICIIATPSAVRKKVLFDVIEQTRVKYFILEKVVFQKEGDFKLAIEAFRSRGIKCWVNCHSRAEQRYRYIKNNIAKDKELKIDALYPPSFNLASSMIHCLDLFCFFRDNYCIEIDLSGIDKEPYDSKHLNCLEFKGTIVARNELGDRITIKQGDVSAQTYIIKNGDSQYFSSEDTDSFTVETPSSKDVFSSKFLWQNSLTNLYIRDIINNDECALPTLEESFEIHKAMFKNIRKHFNIKVVNIT